MKTSHEALGVRAMVRLAQRSSGSEVRAVALVRRADVVVGAPGGVLAGRELHAVQRSITLPPEMLLVLRRRDVLLMAATGRWVLAAPATVLSRWSIGSVDVAVRSGRGPFRPVRIAVGHAQLTVAAPWWRAGQGRALRLIEQVAG